MSDDTTPLWLPGDSLRETELKKPPRTVEVDPGRVTVHVVDGNMRAICGFTTQPPRDWKQGHLFVRLSNPECSLLASCAKCKRLALERDR